jgi:hypothetical protein
MVVETQVFMACATGLTLSTRQIGLDGDPPAHHDAGSPMRVFLGASHCHHLARELVAGDKGITRQWRVAIDTMQIRATDTTCTYANKHFFWLRSGIWHTAHPNAARSINDYGAHQYASLRYLVTY